MEVNHKIESAAFLAIGSELLVGRTQEKNLQTLAKFLNRRGIKLLEARLINDKTEDIRKSVRALARVADILFTSGGIGPTHDDITSAAIAEEFAAPLEVSATHLQMMSAFYKKHGEVMNKAKMKMVLLPRGAQAIENPVSIAPGFQIENVYVLAGVPQVFTAMLSTLEDKIASNARWLSENIGTDMHESQFAEQLGLLQNEYPDCEIGSYPRLDETSDETSDTTREETRDAKSGNGGDTHARLTWKNSIVVSAKNPQKLQELVQKISVMLKNLQGYKEG